MDANVVYCILQKFEETGIRGLENVEAKLVAERATFEMGLTLHSDEKVLIET